MGFKLKKAIFKIDCKYPNCPFDAEFTVTQNLMGITEEDVENEAKKLALGMARIKHDSVYGTKHNLTNPTVKKLSAIYEAIGSKSSTIVNQSEAVKYKEYKQGETILKKGDIATTICEVVKGYAYVDKNPNHKYKPGDSFGAAALLVNQTRTADIIAGEDNTTIAFYNLQELSKKDPRKAKELYTEAMEDIFNIIREMEDLVDKLEKELEKEKMISENRKARVEELENELIECQRTIAEMKGKDSFK
ncbi:MAG TPA: cyclic nucleotide-binding domain-containing protein [Spirochaetota bacterium]|nr:cyclic nucleotide-binding domain-containing protein [Spirochaetota bacterium]HOL57207.1 cyclic nucleotide-binding domain-containing protein [Spirochaetota bacterium]HPP04844.1 cyclic nucleotide-binding domain-containing protein [Spirochaetota bacterium]